MSISNVYEVQYNQLSPSWMVSETACIEVGRDDTCEVGLDDGCDVGRDEG